MNSIKRHRFWDTKIYTNRRERPGRLAGGGFCFISHLILIRFLRILYQTLPFDIL